MSTDRYLITLTDALEAVAKHDPPRTRAFTVAMRALLPVFDHLGAVLGFAKSDMEKKTESLEQAGHFEDLESLVEADRKKGSVTVKDSLARNLHRLMTVIVFLEKILTGLGRDERLSLSAAVSEAYSSTLASYHSFVVRTACNTGFLMLPSRASFLESLGETEESAKVASAHLIPVAQKLIRRIEHLYDCDMPASISWL